jgi:phage terminase small subunit
MKLTTKQRKFVRLYCGNGTEAARLAGYQGSEDVLAHMAEDNLRKPHIAEAIQKRESEEMAPLIAARKDRQEFWTEIMDSTGIEIAERLRASELLGKSEGDFLTKIEHSGSLGLSEAEIDRKIAELEAKNLKEEIK